MCGWGHSSPPPPPGRGEGRTSPGVCPASLWPLPCLLPSPAWHGCSARISVFRHRSGGPSPSPEQAGRDSCSRWQTPPLALTTPAVNLSRGCLWGSGLGVGPWHSRARPLGSWARYIWPYSGLCLETGVLACRVPVVTVGSGLLGGPRGSDCGVPLLCAQRTLSLELLTRVGFVCLPCAPEPAPSRSQLYPGSVCGAWCIVDDQKNGIST